MATNYAERECHDVVGIGFGPANLSLAISLAEFGGQRLSSAFLERKPAFGWHQGMLIENAVMQVCFLKDLATLRNPRSGFSFLAYLQERGRLVNFINQKTLYPSRLEFHDYLEWAAARFRRNVEYGVDVVDLRPIVDGDDVVALDVVGSVGGVRVVRRARNVVIGTGITPALPPGVVRSERVWHSSDLLHRLSDRHRPSRRFVVVGAGQSAAEVAAHLHHRVADSEVHAVFTRYGYSPADSSPFANRIFDPDAVDDFFHAPPSTKQKFYDYHANTNYSVVDSDLIDELSRREYHELVSGRKRLFIHNMSRATNVEQTAAGVRVRIESLLANDVTSVEADTIIYATGYEPMNPQVLLGSMIDLCKRDDAGRLRVERDYRIATGDNVKCRVYLQGGTEHTHGISASLLSNAAVRAGEIVDSIAAGTTP
jgi:L-ornithine N5-oxygenase